jgi:hypothetical protein
MTRQDIDYCISALLYNTMLNDAPFTETEENLRFQRRQKLFF